MGHKGRATLARQGINCKECGDEIEVGTRMAGQMVCNNPDSEEKTPCQEKYYRRKRRKKRIREFVNCVECGTRIDNPHNTQIRCRSEVEGELTECQQIGKARAFKKYQSLKSEMKEKNAGKYVNRRCLKCGETFASESPHNRICPRCTLINDGLYSVAEHTVNGFATMLLE
jgi:hypothetical protein